MKRLSIALAALLIGSIGVAYPFATTEDAEYTAAFKDFYAKAWDYFGGTVPDKTTVVDKAEWLFNNRAKATDAQLSLDEGGFGYALDIYRTYMPSPAGDTIATRFSAMISDLQNKVAPAALKALAAVIPAAGSTVVLGYDQTVGSIKVRRYLYADDRGFLRAAQTATDPSLFASAAQFSLLVLDNKVGLKSTYAGSKNLTVQNVAAVAGFSSWLPDAKETATRAVFSSSKFSADADTEQHFFVEPLSDTDTTLGYRLRHEASGGYLAIDDKAYVRTVDKTAFAALDQPSATICFLTAISGLYQSLAKARAATTVPEKLTLFAAAVNQVRTSDELQVIINEITALVAATRTSETLWTNLVVNKTSFNTFITDLETRFPAVLALTGIYWNKAWSNESLAEGESGDLFLSWTDIKAKINAALLPAAKPVVVVSALTFAEQVSRLSDQLTVLGVSDVPTFMKDLDTMVAQRLDATSDDVEKVKDLFIEVAWNGAVLTYYKGKTPNAQAVIDTKVAAFDQEITYANRVDDLKKFYNGVQLAAGATKFDATAGARFYQKAQALVAMRALATQAQLTDTVSFLEEVRFAKLSDYKDQLGELTQLLNSRLTELGVTTKEAGRSYAERVSAAISLLPIATESMKPAINQEIEFLVKTRAYALKAELASLIKLLEGVRDHNLFGPDTVFAGSSVTKILAELAVALPLGDVVDAFTELAGRKPLADHDRLVMLEKAADIKARKDEFLTVFGSADADKKLLAVSTTMRTLALTVSASDATTLKTVADLLETQRSTLRIYLKPYGSRVADMSLPVTLLQLDSADGATAYFNTLAQLVQDRADGTEVDLTSLVNLLSGNTIRDKIVFRQDLLNRLDQLLMQAKEPITFVDRVRNFTNFIKNNATFVDTNGQSTVLAPGTTKTLTSIFLDKLDLIIKERWRAAAEGFDISYVTRLLEYVVANRLQAFNADGTPKDGAFDSASITATQNYGKTLLTKQTKPSDTALTFAQRLADLITRLPNVTTTLLPPFLDDIQKLINDRAQALDYTQVCSPSISVDKQALTVCKALISKDSPSLPQSSEIQQFKEFLNSAPKKNALFLAKVNKDKLATFLTAIDEQVAYADRYMLAYNLLLNYDFFTDALKVEFLARITRLVADRGLASEDEINATSDLIDFAMTSRFVGDTSGIAYLEARKAELSGGVTLDAYLKAQLAYLDQLSKANFPTMPDATKDEWVIKLRKLVNNVDETTPIDQFEQISAIINTSRVKIFGISSTKFNDLATFIKVFENQWLTNLKSQAAAGTITGSDLTTRLQKLRSVATDTAVTSKIIQWLNTGTTPQ